MHRTRAVPSNILARRRNGNETWRRRSCQCEHIRLNTHEKNLLNGDVPRRNGNVTCSVNRPLAALSASASRPRSPSQTRQHTRRSSRSTVRSPAPDICNYDPWSAGNTTVLKSAQRDAPRPVCGSRETWTAVASGGERLQQLSQPPQCNRSAHKDKLLGRYRRRSLRLPPFPTSRTRGRRPVMSCSHQMALPYIPTDA